MLLMKHLQIEHFLCHTLDNNCPQKLVVDHSRKKLQRIGRGGSRRASDAGSCHEAAGHVR